MDLKTKTAVVVFSNDFRLYDNPALFYAFRDYEFIIPLFAYDENYLGRKFGAASKVFLHYLLHSFNEVIGGKLVIKTGDLLDVLSTIYMKNPFDMVFFNQSYTHKQRAMEKEIVLKFNAKSFCGKVAFDPCKIKNFKVFKYFWQHCLTGINDLKIYPSVSIKKFIKLPGLAVDDLKLLPSKDWYKKIIKYWEFSYDKIYLQASNFLKTKLQNYGNDRNLLSVNGTSKLSPYLRFGVISPKHLIKSSYIQSPTFASEIGWREFAYHSLYYFPNMHQQELKLNFSQFAWEDNASYFKSWKLGETGEEVVDAGMKELWETGYMHNRVRMITASFLTKDLLINWKRGEKWFWDCLCDACPASNPFSWQWVFGSGWDSAPYFRIFNPSLQQTKFDANNLYIKKWRSETKKLKIINHEIQRNIALTKYREILQSKS